MTTANNPQHNNRSLRSDPATHLYAVGQAVRLKGGFGRQAQIGDIYHVTATLPPTGGSPQYRIRNDDERYERMSTQDALEPVALTAPGDDAELIERTFGHGKGTKTQHT